MENSKNFQFGKFKKFPIWKVTINFQFKKFKKFPKFNNFENH